MKAIPRDAVIPDVVDHYEDEDEQEELPQQAGVGPGTADSVVPDVKARVAACVEVCVRAWRGDEEEVKSKVIR